MKFMKYIFSYLPTECYLGFSWKIKQLANIGQYTYNNSIFQSPQNATPKCQQPRSNIPTWKKDKNYQLYVHDMMTFCLIQIPDRWISKVLAAFQNPNWKQPQKW